MARQRRCKYVNCRRTLRQYAGEAEDAFIARTTCDDACAEQCKRVIRWSYEPKDKDWTREREQWPEGVRFDSLSLGSVYGRIARPETHRPYGTSASWAVGGGSDV